MARPRSVFLYQEKGKHCFCMNTLFFYCNENNVLHLRIVLFERFFANDLLNDGFFCSFHTESGRCRVQ